MKADPPPQPIRLIANHGTAVPSGHYRLQGPLTADALAESFSNLETILIIQDAPRSTGILANPRLLPWGDLDAAADRLVVHQSHLSRVLAGKRLSLRLLTRFENLPRDPSGRLLPD